ncbi:MAG: hypothetical protein HUJ57_01525 [Erysipelotrichaceae bacterium]|nr:hypothetical protein [Erysipelotrichaceae bacterium]
MFTVTQRIDNVTQPRGGYVKVGDFAKTEINDGKELNPEENISPSRIGTLVDDLTRFMMGEKLSEAFHMSLIGYEGRIAYMGESQYHKDKKQGLDVVTLLSSVNGLDDESIIAACLASRYEIWARNPFYAITSMDDDNKWPDKPTIENIRLMVERSCTFMKKNGGVTKTGFDFLEKDEEGNIIHNGYSEYVVQGDGDILTKDTMWEFKVTKSRPTSKHTLQLLMYWIMGKHSGMDIYKHIDKIGIYNPRLNVAYVLETSKIPDSVIKEVEEDVICY